MIPVPLSPSYLQMEYWLKKSYFDAIEAYPAGETKESRRQKLASTINSYLSIAPPARLLTLLQQALAYEKEKGILLEGDRLDIFHNTLESSTLEDAIPTVKVHFSSGRSPCRALVSNSHKTHIPRRSACLQMVSL